MTTPTTAIARTATTPAAAGLPSRRTFLAGAAAASAVGVTGSVVSGAFRPAAAATTTPTTTTLPLVTPAWSEAVRRSFGVAVQPQMLQAPYGSVSAWPKYAADLGVTYIRGKYSPLPMLKAATASIVDQCRTYNLKWVMTVLPEDWSMTLDQLRAVLVHIRDNAADVCIAIEGINEPNSNRDGSPVRPDWAQAAVAYQQVIAEFVRSTPALANVAVIGPSLQMGGDDPSIDFNALGAAGVVSFMDYAGIHSYPGGLKPDSKIDTRLGYVSGAWGSVPTWVSETGYTNSMSAPLVGPRPVPFDVAATYGPRSLVEYFSRGCNSARYELLSEPNPTDDEPEDAYGLISCPSNDPATWTVKPEYTVMRDFLATLKDNAPAGATTFTPAAVPLKVTAPSTVKWLLVGKADGTTTLLAYLNSSIWDVTKRVRLTPAPVDVTIVDRVGSRTVKIGTTLTQVPLR